MLLNLVRLVGDTSPQTCIHARLGSFGLYFLINPDALDVVFFLMFLKTDDESYILESLIV